MGPQMADAFIIMQIGNVALDDMCSKAILPAIRACGLDPKRVDKHNSGQLLKSEIIRFIQDADIIIADLTNERPNCYLEIGYVMGIDKFKNLIFTVRSDHFPDSPDYVKGGPKIHFDLAGYDILSWNSASLSTFKDELERRIKRRQAILAPSSARAEPIWDDQWISTHRDVALPRARATGKNGIMEVRFALKPKISKTQSELNDAAREATIDTFGWPIAVYLSNRDEYRPVPIADGIVSTIDVVDRSTFDYWTLRKNGDFFLLKTIFEDMRD